MHGPRPVYSWDTCVFLAWLKQEPNKPLAFLEDVVVEIDSGVADLTFLTVVLTELLILKTDSNLRDLFDQFVQRSNVRIQPVTASIASLAAKLRLELRLKTPDAIVLATAIETGSDVLHTYDDQVCQCDGNSIVGSLRVTWPEVFSTGN